MPTRRGKIGLWGETQACYFLERQGFTIIDRNYYTTVGEIDIVATKAGDYYFIEVKTRAAGSMATDLAVTADKKRKLSKTVKVYCYRHRIAEVGLLKASLMVVFDRSKDTLSFRLAVFG